MLHVLGTSQGTKTQSNPDGKKDPYERQIGCNGGPNARRVHFENWAGALGQVGPVQAAVPVGSLKATQVVADYDGAGRA